MKDNEQNKLLESAFGVSGDQQALGRRGASWGKSPVRRTDKLVMRSMSNSKQIVNASRQQPKRSATSCSFLFSNNLQQIKSARLTKSRLECSNQHKASRQNLKALDLQYFVEQESRSGLGLLGTSFTTTLNSPVLPMRKKVSTANLAIPANDLVRVAPKVQHKILNLERHTNKLEKENDQLRQDLAGQATTMKSLTKEVNCLKQNEFALVVHKVKEAQMLKLKKELEQAHKNLQFSKSILKTTIAAKLEYEEIILKCLKRSSLKEKVLQIIEKVTKANRKDGKSKLTNEPQSLDQILSRPSLPQPKEMMTFGEHQIRQLAPQPKVKSLTPSVGAVVSFETAKDNKTLLKDDAAAAS